MTTAGPAATSVVLDLATGSPGSDGGLTVWPEGAARPAAGRIDFYNSGSTGVDVVAAVTGCYAATTGRTFVPTATTTVLDTRCGIGRTGASPLAAGAP